jgi:hypothetical protein
MNKDQYFDYLPDEKGILKLKSFAEEISPEFKAKIMDRWEKTQSLDFYLGMYATIRVMQSLPSLPRPLEEFFTQFGIGCICVIAEKD